MKKITLQWRITLLTALVLLLCTVALTTYSIYNADRSFMPLLQQATIPAKELLPPTAVTTEPISPIEGASTPEDSSILNATPTVSLEAVVVQSAKQSFDLKSILFCILFTFFGTGAVYFATGKALRPLRKLNMQVDTIDEHSLSARLSLPTSEDEINALTLAFNQMLSRLEDAFVRQKRFTSNAAHELKTPLATIKTGLQVLNRDSHASLQDYEANSKLILESLNRLSLVVDDLLLLASSENISSLSIEERELEPISLDSLMDAIQWELKSKIDAKKLQCTINCNDICLLGNASLLYRVFYNLIENCCKYIQENGSIHITAQVKKKDLIISVKDNGPGIAAEHLPYIFDAFYRVDDSRSRNAGGSGLGLSIVRTIVKSCQGDITIKSTEHFGTEFILTFPSTLLTKI